MSSEISVKGGKGIWGMPKHQANLDFVITPTTVSSQYDVDGLLGARIEIDRPPATALPLDVGAANYCVFRGMVMRSSIYFQGAADVALGRRATRAAGPRRRPAGRTAARRSTSTRTRCSPPSCRRPAACSTTTSSAGS